MLMLCACAGSDFSNAVDIFDGTSGRWTTAALSVARYLLAATSLPNQGLAIFGGGWNGTYVILVFELLILQDGVMWELGGMCCAEGGAL
jgi:hypothetical protein